MERIKVVCTTIVVSVVFISMAACSAAVFAAPETVVRECR